MTAPTPRRGRRIVENRELIAHDLDSTLIVEAAAGTGKTTELVGRIVALIENQRATIGQIVAGEEIATVNRLGGECLESRLEIYEAAITEIPLRRKFLVVPT